MGNERSGRPRGDANGPGYRNYTLRLPEPLIERIDRLSECSAVPRFRLVEAMISDGLALAESNVDQELLRMFDARNERAAAIT